MALATSRFQSILFKVTLGLVGLLIILKVAAISGVSYDSIRPVTSGKTGVGSPQTQDTQPQQPPAAPAVQEVQQHESPPPKELSWLEIATKHGTDKVTTHEYQYMYMKYLPDLRHRHVKMLEIGLGCNMEYGPGASYSTWLEYFPDVELYFIEYDATCASKWAHRTTNAQVFTGDQANGTFLEEFIAAAGTDFDFIIDDGGHTMHQQIVSIQHLWKAVRPGGYYFLEDLQTSYETVYGGDPSATNSSIFTATKFIYQLIDDKMMGWKTHPISKDMRSVDCMREVCAMTKKKPNNAI